MAVRRIVPNWRSTTGAVDSLHTEDEHAFESGLERDFLVRERFRRDLVAIETQPLRIDYVDADGRSRHYTPDALVRYRFGGGERVELCEVKYWVDLKRGWADLKPGFIAAQVYCRARGWRFRLVTECAVRDGFFENARFLARYLRCPPAEDDLRKVLEVISESGWKRLGEVLEAARDYERGWEVYVASVYCLVARGMLSANLDQLLSRETAFKVVRSN